MKKNNDNVKNVIKEVIKKTSKAKGEILTDEELEKKAIKILAEKEEKQLAEKEKRKLERKKKKEEKRKLEEQKMKEKPKTVDELEKKLNDSLNSFTEEMKSNIQAFQNSKDKYLNEYDMDNIARQVFYTFDDFQKNIIGYLRNIENKKSN